jgi:hypothetical protein
LADPIVVVHTPTTNIATLEDAIHQLSLLIEDNGSESIAIAKDVMTYAIEILKKKQTPVLVNAGGISSEESWYSIKTLKDEVDGLKKLNSTLTQQIRCLSDHGYSALADTDNALLNAPVSQSSHKVIGRKTLSFEKLLLSR